MLDEGVVTPVKGDSSVRKAAPCPDHDGHDPGRVPFGVREYEPQVRFRVRALSKEQRTSSTNEIH